MNIVDLNEKEDHGVSFNSLLVIRFITSTDPAVNKEYGLFDNTLKTQHNNAIVPAVTDNHFLKALGYKAFDFSSIANIAIRLRENVASIDDSVFPEACQVYVALIIKRIRIIR